LSTLPPSFILPGMDVGTRLGHGSGPHPAMPMPVPIGDYGFLSDGETTALVAPGRLDRVDVPAPHGLHECLRLDPRAARRLTICWFWLVSALCEIGEHKRTRELGAKLLSFAGPLELYAEEINPHTGRQLGNFAQAFTHLALINAVLHVIATEQMSERLGTNRRTQHSMTSG
jgi:hypothetical protein